jgi:hypothetical protein
MHLTGALGSKDWTWRYISYSHTNTDVFFFLLSLLYKKYKSCLRACKPRRVKRLSQAYEVLANTHNTMGDQGAYLFEHISPPPPPAKNVPKFPPSRGAQIAASLGGSDMGGIDQLTWGSSVVSHGTPAVRRGIVVAVGDYATAAQRASRSK